MCLNFLDIHVLGLEALGFRAGLGAVLLCSLVYLVSRPQTPGFYGRTPLAFPAPSLYSLTNTCSLVAL